MPLTDAELMQATALAVTRYSFIKKIISTGQSFTANVFNTDEYPLPPPYMGECTADLSILGSSFFRLCLVTETLLGCTSDNRGGAEYGESLTLIYTPVTMFNLPSAVTVKMGAATLTQGIDYTWNQTSGKLHISSVTDLIDITVTCVLDGTLYTQCNYLQSSGTQWINTGIIGSGATKVFIDFSIVSNPSGWWGLFGACVANINRSLLFGITPYYKGFSRKAGA